MASSSASTQSFPPGVDYVEALQNPSLCFRDPDLRNGRPGLDGLGRPRPVSGNYASVFSITAPSGEKYALKCFTRDVGSDQRVRYEAIHDALLQVGHSWKVGFAYLADGVMVSGCWYPMLKMDWVQGVGLANWIDQKLGEADALSDLARRFAALAADLDHTGIAHGDLQHGNLMVSADGSLKLVDYDGMYVPALHGMTGTETGHHNYQQPARSLADFNPAIDRFSAWVIYTSLVAVSVEPALWRDLRHQGDEHLLLAREDFLSPSGSLRFATLLAHPDPAVHGLASRVRGLVDVPVASVPPLEPLRLGAYSGGASPAPTRSPVGIPRWIDDHLPPPPAQEPVRLGNPQPGVRILSIGMMLVIALTIILAGIGIVSAAVGAVAALTVAGVCLAATAGIYRSTPESEQARAARKLHERAAAAVRSSSRQIADLTKRINELEHADLRSEEVHKQEQRKLQAQHEGNLTRTRQDTQQQLAKIDGQLRSADNDYRRLYDAALHRHQEDHVRDRLTRAKVSSARIPGIGDSLVRNLYMAGIRTAADFVGISLQAGTYQSRVAYFRLTNGRPVRVPGIGEVKAGRLDDWRNSQAAIARRTQPTALPAVVQHGLQQQHEDRRRGLQVQRDGIQRTRSQQEEALVRKLSSDRTALLDDLRRAKLTNTNSRAESVQRKADLEDDLRGQRRQLAAATTESARFDRVRYRHYLRRTLFGR